MAKKNRIPFRREIDDLTTIDDDLDKAIAELDGANGRINELLQSMEPPKQQPETADSAVDNIPLQVLQEDPQHTESSQGDETG